MIPPNPSDFSLRAFAKGRNILLRERDGVNVEVEVAVGDEVVLEAYSADVGAGRDVGEGFGASESGFDVTFPLTGDPGVAGIVFVDVEAEFTGACG